MRRGLVDPTAPALRAPLRCSRFAGSAQTRFAQTCAALIRERLRCSAAQRGRPARSAYQAQGGVQRAVSTSNGSIAAQRRQASYSACLAKLRTEVGNDRTISAR